MTGGAGDDVAWGEGHRSGSEGCPPSPPSRTEAVFLDGGEPGQGGAFAGRFFPARMAGKKPRRRPAGRPAKQQPDAALEAACRLSRQWSLRGGGEGLVGGRDHLAQVAASETLECRGVLPSLYSRPLM